MNSAASVAVKGWCPGALRPMASGDGLIVRVRPFGGALALDQANGLAALAERLGNGHIDLTRRANLQLRGLTDERLPELHSALARLDLTDADVESEARRNVMVAPLAGLDPGEAFDIRPIATALEQALATDRRLQALPPKFGLLVDGGGTLSLAGERADICLSASGDGVAFGLDTPTGTQWLGRATRERAVETAVEIARAFLAVAASGRMRDHVAKVRPLVAPLLSPLAGTPKVGGRRIGLLETAVGIAAPFGRLEARQLSRLAALAALGGARDLRLSPWRSLYIGVPDPALIESARAIGLIVDDDDPVLRIDACPGKPGCSASSVDTRGDARRLAALAMQYDYRGSIHVSGCAKGCARSAPADLVLIGEAGRYRVGRRLIDGRDFASLFPESRDG
jgi:precorrin-3B synthase